jgi:hypothetical protein
MNVPVQFVEMAALHTPVRQHAPFTGHGEGEHAPVCHVPVHADSRVAVQPPTTRQHAPNAGGAAHVSAVLSQAGDEGSKTAPSMTLHCSCVRVKHRPSGVQHLPVWPWAMEAVRRRMTAVQRGPVMVRSDVFMGTAPMRESTSRTRRCAPMNMRVGAGREQFLARRLYVRRLLGR